MTALRSMPRVRLSKRFNGGLGVFEFGQFQEARTAPVLTAMDFAVNQKAQPFFKAHGGDAAGLELLLQCLGHGFQAQAAQLAQRWCSASWWNPFCLFHW